MFLALIGYRGSGKSAVAQLVAQELGWNWVDADVEIELHAGKPIAAIFSEDGEAAFRKLEGGKLRELVALDRTVLALGGGVVLREENRKLLKSACEAGRGKAIWLKATPQTLHNRIETDETTANRRPKLTTDGGLAEVQKLLAVREPFYHQCADVEIDTESKTMAEVAKEIVAWMQHQPPAGTRG